MIMRKWLRDPVPEIPEIPEIPPVWWRPPLSDAARAISGISGISGKAVGSPSGDTEGSAYIIGSPDITGSGDRTGSAPITSSADITSSTSMMVAARGTFCQVEHFLLAALIIGCSEGVP